MMKGIKRLLALCVALCLCIGLGGCRKKDNQQPGTETDVSSTLGTIAEYSGETTQGEERGAGDGGSQTQSNGQGSGVSSAEGSSPHGQASGGAAAGVTTVKTTAAAEQKQLSCTLTIHCKALLSHMDKLPENKRKLVPASGVFYSRSLTFQEGETAYDVLKRSGVRVDASYTPAYGSIYMKGIANLYEKDCGGTSGWLFAINGSLPGYGCNKYKLKHGDRVEFFYTI